MKRRATGFLCLALALLVGACQQGSTPTGTVQVVINGLPDGVEAVVTVSGPQGFSRQLASGATLSGLAPGSYLVSADSVSDGGETFVPEPRSQDVVVEAGGSAAVSVVYARDLEGKGGLELTISGLPAGVEALVTVSGPEKFGRVLAESTNLIGLVPGDYVVTAVDVEADGDTYIADPSSVNVLVPAGETATLSVVYSPRGAGTGGLDVIISGLPADAEADVAVIDEKGFTQKVTAGTTLSDLMPGDYTLAATEVGVSPYTFAPDQASQVVTVEAGSTARVTVRYAAVTGAVALMIGGLPSGATASVTFESTGDAAAEPALLTETATLADLIPGSYSVTAEAIAFDGFHFKPDTFTVSLEVNAGETATVSISYQPVDGKLLVVPDGLPGGSTVSLGNLVGPGLEGGHMIDTDTFLEGLEPGSYAFSTILMEVVIEDIRYSVTMPTEVEVKPGEIVTVPVRFDPQQGDLLLEISGLPDGAEANVTVTGPSSFESEVKHSTTLFGLEPGDYTVTAHNVPDPDGGKAYEPCLHEPQIVMVVAGEVAAVNVQYAKPQEVIAQSHCVLLPPFTAAPSAKEAR